jgi:hypothetical protein
MSADADFNYDDRPRVEPYLDNGLAQIEIIVAGERVTKPGMKSVFIEDDYTAIVDDGYTVRGEYCTCNSVQYCTCNSVCTCESVCSCEYVCGCDGHCSCDQVCSCDGNCSCLSVSGNTYCSCVPVH